MTLLLLLMGCQSYYATGGGELEVRLHDGGPVETLIIPGQTEGLVDHLPASGADVPNCTQDDVAWLYQVDDTPWSLQSCGEPVELVVWLDFDLPYGEELNGEEAGVELHMLLPDGDVAHSYHEPELTLFLETRDSGWIRHLSMPVWEGRGDSARWGDPYKEISVELEWDFDSWMRAKIRQEFTGL